ncbi:unnamed protein product [Cylindrotheca closterium]|uniref:glutathione gamma-glutamylcysteinyltransferase n=1 Tax=Cylindrotheca closterium TaxID=2856 RepID=A0AAD2CE68_9STRA|nr:unnamed protein product [Cylindrotheca closterium]
MSSSEQSPLLLPTNKQYNTVGLNQISSSTDEETSERKAMVATWTMAAIIVVIMTFAMTESSSAHKRSAQHAAKVDQVKTVYSHRSPQDAANAKLFRDEELKRASVDSFIEAFAKETTQSFSTHLYRGSREKLRRLLYLNTTSAYHDLVTDRKSSALDFYQYVQGGWDAQINQGYCPVAAAAAVLNSLRGHIELPQDPLYIPYPWATQFQLLHDTCVKETVLDVEDPRVVWVGLPLEMAAGILECHLSPQGYTVEIYHIDPAKIDKYTTKKLIRDAVLDPKARVMINYDRGNIGQGDPEHGHFSPIGAYNYKKDAFLIMDVAKYKFPPVWVPSANLYYGVSTIDNCAGFEYPQDARVTEELEAENPPNFTRWYEALQCEPKYRGVIIVKPRK